MKTTLLTREAIENEDITVPVDVSDCIFFRLVGIGPKTMEDNAFSLQKVAKIVDDMPGWCIITDKGAMRKSLHELVDRFCDERESIDGK